MLTPEVTTDTIKNSIIELPGRRPAMLAQDLAQLYGKETREINQAMKRNPDRFPDDFCFQATEKETETLRSQNEMSQKARTARPYLFTQEGANMLSAVLKSPMAARRAVQIIRAFTKLEQGVPSLPDFTDPIAAGQAWVDAQKEIKALADTNRQQQQVLQEQTRRITYLDTILGSPGTVTITQIAKDYGKSGIIMNRILHKAGVQYKTGTGQWLLYQKYANQGYVKSRTTTFIRSGGREDSKMLTRWTQKGRLFIHQLLCELDIHAVMDQEVSDVDAA